MIRNVVEKKALDNKKILFIGPKTFNYENEIINALLKMGAQVDYYDDRPSTGALSKILLRIAPGFLKKKIYNYFQNLIDETRVSTYDIVFIIKLEVFPLDLFKQLKMSQSQAQFIYYSWDSFANNPNPIAILSEFDRALCFDPEDSIKYNLGFRPLFYIDAYKIPQKHDLLYDLSFIGSVHVQRYKLLSQFKKQHSDNFKLYIYMYVPSKFLFWMRKVFLPHIYGRSKSDEFEFNPLDKRSVSKVFFQSKAIIDFAHHKQQGLTMRSIEALGANKKLVTNNESISQYDFYNSDNIFVLNKRNKTTLAEFLKADYVSIDSKLYEKYSIDGWIKEVFGINEKEEKCF